MLPALAQTAALARTRLATDVWDYYDCGAGDETARAEATAAWAGLRFRPRVLRPVGAVDVSTRLLGRAFATPLMAAPSALHGLAHPEAEAVTARGLAAAGSLFVLSTRSSITPGEAVAGPWWYQLYVLRDRALTDALIDRAVEAGAEALVLTVDTPVLGFKRRGMRDIRRADLLASLVPLIGDRQIDGSAIEQDPDLTPDVIASIAEASGLPVVVKGVLRGDDAVRLVDAGASAVYVSNHGGRQMDRAVATARALPEVVDAVGDRAEIYVDGGVRSGTDAAAALALGARAVFLGRPVLWGLAASGADGVQRVIEELTDDLRREMALLGAASLADLDRDLVVER